MTGYLARPLAPLRVLGAVALLAVALLAAIPGRGAQEPKPKPQEEGGTIRGTVLGAGDRPLGFVRVAVEGNGASVATLTNPDGLFEVKVPKVGRYTVDLDLKGYRSTRTRVSIDQPLQVATPTIRMTAYLLLVRVGTVVGPNKTQPLGNVEVTLTPHDDAGEPIRDETDASGTCYFSNVRVGTTYTVKAALTGYLPSTQDATVFQASEPVETNITLAKGVSIPIAPSKQLYGTPRLPSDQVQTIFQDDLGYLWFGTDRGVARFDGTNFESTDAPGSELGPLSAKDVRCIAQLDGDVWFGVEGGMWRLGKQGVRLVPDFEGQTVNAVATDASGDTWIGTSTGLYRRSGGALSRLATGAFTALVTDAVDRSLWVVGGDAPGLLHLVDGQMRQVPFAASAALGGKPVTAVRRTRPGDLLIGTSDGAYRLVGDEPEPFLPEEIKSSVIAFAEDVRGNVWIATEKGAVTYDVRRRLSNIEYAGERINGLVTDREGNLWFATEKGAIRRDLYSFVPIHGSDGLFSNNVDWIYPDHTPDGSPQLWFVTAAPGGVQVLSPSSRFEVYDKLNPEASVAHLIRDRAGALWLATNLGVFHQAGDALEQVTEDPAVWLAEMPGGQIYVATKVGVRVFNGKTFDAVPDLTQYTATRLFAIGDALWLATNHGAIRYVPATRTVEAIDVSRGVQGEAVHWIAADTANHVWLATDTGGAEVLDAGTLKKVIGNAGVNAGADARSLLLDRDGFMWVGSADGSVRKIAFYEGGVVETTYPPDQGAPFVNAIVEDASGTLWFATNGGAMQHLPSTVPPAVVPRVEVDGRPFDESSVIPAGQHTIRFLFHGITMLGDVRYLYRLDSDGDWTLLPQRQELEREVMFTDLPAGGHTFELRALNRDLYGIDATPVRMEIRIDVPVWQKWWFYGLGALGLVGLGIGSGVVYRYKTREYVLPPELRHYVPIEPNPYIVGNPIRNEAMFFGREDDFRYVRTKLEGSSQGVVVVLCGDRRTGKSSVLYQILNGRLGARFIPVFVDLQEMVVANDREFFRRLARLIGEAVDVDRAEVDRFGFGDETANPYHVFSDFLDSILERIGDRTLLVLVDEYELLESKVDEGRLDSEIFLFLAGLIDNKERLSFIFTGSRRLEDRDRRYWREMLRRSLFRKIGFLSQNDTRRLTTEPVAGRVVFGRNVVDRIVRLTAGQPFYVQVVCQTAVDYLNEHERNALAMADLDRVVGEIVDHPLPQMIYFWEALSADEKVVLSLLALQLDGTNEHGWASAADLVALVEREKAPVDLSEHTIHLTLEELFRTEVLEKSPFESYRFRIDLLRIWIRRSHSIWQVLKNP